MRLKRSMSDPDLKAVTAQVRKLTARVEALEKLLDRILRQKPVSERQLEKALKSRNLSGADMPQTRHAQIKLG